MRRFGAGLRLLEEHEARLAVLRQALAKGEESGPADYFLQDVIAQLDKESPQ